MDRVKKLWQYRAFVCSNFLDALGIMMLLWSVLAILIPEECLSSLGRWCVLGFIVLISIGWAIFKLFNRPVKLELEINKRTKLTIEKGDVFTLSEKGACVIPVNEYFDTHLGDGIINSKSVHGQFLSIFSDKLPKWRRDIDNQLSKKEELPKYRQRDLIEGLPQSRYPLGTCVRIIDGERIFILVAVTRFNKEEHVDVAAEEYPEVIRKMFNGIENLQDGKTVYIPLIGSGIAGYQLNEMQMLNTIVQAAHNADKLAITNGIHICIYGEEMWNKLNLNVIEYLYNRWKTLK